MSFKKQTAKDFDLSLWVIEEIYEQSDGLIDFYKRLEEHISARQQIV